METLKNLGNSARIVTALMAVGGVIYQTGRLTHKLDALVPQVHALENEKKDIQDTLFEIHGKVSSMNEKVDMMTEDMKEIKRKMFR
tara:strand:- start:73 stop:330 length:258 start_codon:yes stop_codon:yes gene_type:complete